MPKHPITFAAVTALLAACSSSPTAPTASSAMPVDRPSFSQTEPGTPGEANCRGQTTAFLAQAGKNTDADFRGIGGIARENDLTVQEVKAIVDAFCAGP